MSYREDVMGQRSYRDRQLQQEFGQLSSIPRQKSSPPIGVSGNDGPQRSARDIQLQLDFGDLENFQGSSVYYKRGGENFQGSSVYYKRAGENYQENFHGVKVEDPYNPYSKYAKYMPLQ